MLSRKNNCLQTTGTIRILFYIKCVHTGKINCTRNEQGRRMNSIQYLKANNRNTGWYIEDSFAAFAFKQIRYLMRQKSY